MKTGENAVSPDGDEIKAVCSKARVVCTCGREIREKYFTEHLKTQIHQKLMENISKTDTESLGSKAVLFDLASYLRETDLRGNKKLILSIAERDKNRDPYTNKYYEYTEDQSMTGNLHVDHVHEIQTLTYAIIGNTRFSLTNPQISLLNPLKIVLNGMKNLVITDAKVNQSKGQATKYFLGNVKKTREISLPAAFLHTARGKQRLINSISINIIETMRSNSTDFSQSVREAQCDNGRVTNHLFYEELAESFDEIVQRMNFDWQETMKLRDGKTYQACRTVQSSRNI